MSRLLSSAAKATTPTEKATDILRKANAKNWKVTLGKAREILEGMLR